MTNRPAMPLRFRSLEQYESIKREAKKYKISVNEYALRAIEYCQKISDELELSHQQPAK